MKFTNIFDMTGESSTSQNHEADDTETMLNDDDQQDNIQHDIEVLLPESKEIMSDWTCAEIKIDEINSDPMENDDMRQDLSPTGSSSSIESMDSFYKPEADQSDQMLSEHVTNALRRDIRDYTTIASDNE